MTSKTNQGFVILIQEPLTTMIYPFCRIILINNYDFSSLQYFYFTFFKATKLNSFLERELFDRDHNGTTPKGHGSRTEWNQERRLDNHGSQCGLAKDRMSLPTLGL